MNKKSTTPKSKNRSGRQKTSDPCTFCQSAYSEPNFDFSECRDLRDSQPVEAFSSSYRGRQYNEYMSDGVETIGYDDGTAGNFSDVAALAGLHIPAWLTRETFDAILDAAGNPESVEIQREVFKSIFMDLEIALRCIRTKSILLFEASVQQQNGSTKTLRLRSEIRSSRYSGPAVTLFIRK